MKDQKVGDNNKKFLIPTVAGAAIMILLTLTKVMPTLKIAGYSVFVGIAFFFITEAAAKTPRAESGLRFNTVFEDLKKPGAIVWALLPAFSGILTLIIGDLIFGEEFKAHLMGRAGEILSFDKALLMMVEIIVAAFGEEIAYRGFFLGKGMKICPFWVCAVVSSAAFAAGHIAAGNVRIVIYDITCVFIDSIIYSVVYRKSGNCVISALSHILANASAIFAALAGA